MALYAQPASPFCTRLPTDVILNVAYELSIIDRLGPPRHLPPLLRVCRFIYDILSANRNALYARVFRAKFDTRAPLRRLGRAALANPALAFQLVKQTLALKRLKSAHLDSENLLSDLWTAFVMFIENDGRNHLHLTEYARIHDLVDDYMESRIWAHRMHSGTGWPLDITPNALIVWLLWFTMTPERLRAMIPDRREQYMDKLRPFAIAPLQYSPFFAPDNHFSFPINEALRDNSQFPDGTAFAYFPMYREPAMVMERVIHFGQEIVIMSPMLGLGAKMVFLMLAEAVPYEPPSVLPIDRAHADPADGVRPTQADFVEWALIRGVQFYHPGQWERTNTLQPSAIRLEDTPAEEPESISSYFDNDWNRLTGCVDPYRDLPLKRGAYTFGSIAGMFAGRMQIPEFFKYREMVHGTNMPDVAVFPSLAEVPVYVRFREYHCVNPAVPIPIGGSQPGFDDGVLNAYLPSTFDCQHVANTLRITFAGMRAATRYEAYVQGKPSSHNPSSCSMCISRARKEEEQLRERVAARLNASSIEPSPPSDEDGPKIEDDAEEDLEYTDVVPATRQRRGSTSSTESHESYFYGDENDPENVLRTSQMMLERDAPTEALLREFMTEDVPDYRDEASLEECTGVEDIIITGETLPRHGDAWHHYRFYGRVRAWDGLIVLVRVPTLFPAAGKTIFRGYMVGNRNFVGSWRSYAENIEAIPLEGPFALSRVDETPQAPSSASSSNLAPAALPAPDADVAVD